jgi:hypothetical protein
MRRLLNIALLFLASCHSTPEFPAGGYAYPQTIPIRNDTFFFYPAKERMSKRDSFLNITAAVTYARFGESNISLKPLSSPLFRFYHVEGWGSSVSEVFIILTKDSLTVKLCLDGPQPFISGPIDSPHLRKRTSIPNPVWRYTTQTKPISSKQYRAFIQLLNRSKYWQMPPVSPCDDIADGDYFFLEANTPEKYNFVSGPSCPGDSSDYYKACETLIRYAGLGKKIHLIWTSKLAADSARAPLIVEDVQLEDVKQETPPKHKHKKQPARRPRQNASPNAK